MSASIYSTTRNPVAIRKERKRQKRKAAMTGADGEVMRQKCKEGRQGRHSHKEAVDGGGPEKLGKALRPELESLC